MMDNDISCQRPNVITCTVGSSVVVVVVEMALVLMMSAVAVVLIVAFNGRLEFDWASSAIPFLLDRWGHFEQSMLFGFVG